MLVVGLTTKTVESAMKARNALGELRTMPAELPLRPLQSSSTRHQWVLWHGINKPDVPLLHHFV